MVDARPRVLAIAFVCSPAMGTEPGAGWGVVTALGEFADVTVLTGSRYLGDIRAWEDAHPGSPIRFVEIPDRLADRLTSWHRIPEFLHYLTWLRRAKQKALELLDGGQYDVAMHITFSAFWLPSPVVDLGVPSVWGPVGGAVTTPKPLRELLGAGGIIQEALDFAAVRLMAALPATKRTAVTATERLIQNEETRSMLPEAAREQCRILNHVMFSVVPEFAPEEDGNYVLWVSPMQSRKGPRLALESLALTRDDVTLRMVGDGPQRRHLERAARDLGVADRVTFTGVVAREEVVRLMRAASTVLFTGLREEGGLALAEAMYAARRVIVIDHGGAGTIARAATDPARVALVSPSDVANTAARLADAMERHLDAPPVASLPLLDRSAAVAEMASAIEAARAKGSGSPGISNRG
jgi:glycosyltransferase involved in cell wall biosynthesis